MKLGKIQINRFRQLDHVVLNFEDNITVIAGSNNSGKTSLTELLGYVFAPLRGKFSRSDIPIKECENWANEIFKAIRIIFKKSSEKNIRLSEISNLVFPADDTSPALIIPPIEIKLQVDYDPVTDDIRNFADYLMDLDKDKNSFFFIVRYTIKRETFQKQLETIYEKLASRLQSFETNKKQQSQSIAGIKELLLSTYASSMSEFAYFTDCEYNIEVAMEISKFRKLFNYRSIEAGRNLDDRQDDNTHALSKNMLDIASKADEWTKLLETLPDEIRKPIEKTGIKSVVQKTSIDSLATTIKAISETNGNNTGNVVIDFSLEEHILKSFLQDALTAKYEKDGVYLNESSQGLGYSNLIYLHLQLQKFKLTIDPLLVNFFVIEEPESHMHPQMQNVFAEYLFTFYKENKYQGFITTHSHEIVSNAEIKHLRVLRQITAFASKLYDLRSFYEKYEKAEKDLLLFYERLFIINFADILFADKVIMFEGDTERMLIKYAIQTPTFIKLKNQYLSYIQVGGAYACNYIPLIQFLEIKTAILTDLDYSTTAHTLPGIKRSTTTNATILKAAHCHLNVSKVSVAKLYNWKKNFRPILLDKSICLSFQGEEDGYARTLEEAMLSKLYSKSVLDKEDRTTWISRRTSDKLKFSIPKNKSKINIRDIVSATSRGKTDFMYSVIMNGLVEKMLPTYISEALKWLM